MSMAQESGPAAAALAKLTIVIRDEQKRGEFLDDPEGMMEREGVIAADIPEPALQAIKDLGPDELRLISEFCDKFTEAGLSFEADGGTVCFF
jgi:hypothetical protein